MMQFFKFLAAILFLTLTMPVAAPADTQWVSLKADPDYADVQAQLLALVNIEGFHADNNFCIVAQRLDDGSMRAMVYWPTEDKLIDWEQMAQNVDSLVTSNALNLNTDVMPSEDDIHGSTYLVTSGWVRNVVHECNRHGDFYHITRSAGGWHRPEDFPQFSTLPPQLETLIVPTSFLIKTGIDNDRDGFPAGKQLKPVNHFCVVAQKDRTWLAAYVYWKTEQRLILWLPEPDDDNNIHIALYDTPEIVNLNVMDQVKKIVGNEADQMPEDYVNSILDACKKSGAELTIYTKSNSSTIEAK